MHKNIAQIIEKLSEEFPSHTVATDETGSLNYSELDRRANKLANYIIQKAGKDNNQVSFLIEHGAEQVVAILAILKAGKCCVPLDINFPLDRNKICLDDSETILLIANNMTCNKALELLTPDKIINMDELPGNIPGYNPGLDFSPEIRSFIFYTSGSSGKPKGVVYTHISLMSSISSWHFTEDDVILNLFSCSYGIHHIPVFGALLNRANVCFFDVKKHSLNELKNYFHEKRISICIIVTSVLRQFLDTLAENDNPIFCNLKKVVPTGDPLYRNDVARIFNIMGPNIELVNMYGSTEITAVAFCRVTRELLNFDSIIPVGMPPDNMRISIIGDSYNICNEYEVGKLHVNGPQVAYGYWKHPELNHQFITDDNDHTRRTFITNDLGFRRKDGCIVLTGRDDTVVKVRGNTVDLSEIEKNIMENDTIREAFVVQKEFNSQKYLVVYYTTKFETPQLEFKIRDSLKKNLPDFMLPDFYINLKQLPRVESGKINRKAFPEPDWPVLLNRGEYIPPENEIQTTIIHIFERISRISPIGINQNIFDLSIDSLRILVIINEIEKKYNITLSTEEVIKSPYISNIAELVNISLKR